MGEDVVEKARQIMKVPHKKNAEHLKIHGYRKT